MPAMNFKYTINIEPVNDHLKVTVPEIGVTVETTGTTRKEAIDAAHQAIIEYVQQGHKKRSARRKSNQQVPQAS